MIKTIQNWRDVRKQKKDVRKQKKLEQQRQELIKIGKVIMGDTVKQLILYGIGCHFSCYQDRCGLFVCTLICDFCRIDFDISADVIEVKFKEETIIATYEHLKWYQIFKKSTKKKFYHAEDAVEDISNMIIMGEAI